MSENICFEDHHHGSSSNHITVQKHVNDLTGNITDFNVQTGNFTIIFPSLNLKEKLRQMTNANSMIASSCSCKGSNSSSIMVAHTRFSQIKKCLKVAISAFMNAIFGHGVVL